MEVVQKLKSTIRVSSRPWISLFLNIQMSRYLYYEIFRYLDQFRIDDSQKYLIIELLRYDEKFSYNLMHVMRRFRLISISGSWSDL